MAQLYIVSTDIDEANQLLANLDTEKHDVEFFLNPRKAHNAAKKSLPDGVLVVAGLVGTGDLSFCRTLKGLPKADNLHIMLISLPLSFEESEEAFSAGVSTILTRPYKAAAVQLKVDNMLAGDDVPDEGLNVPPLLRDAYDKVLKNSRQLGDVAEVVSGIAVRNRSQWLAEIKRGPDWLPILVHENIRPFAIIPSGMHVRYEPRQLVHAPPPKLMNQKKVIVRRAAPPLIAAVDDMGFQIDSSLHAVVPVEGLLPGYITGLLNSRVIDFFIHRIRPLRSRAGVTPMLRTVDLEALPIIIPDMNSQKALAAIVDELAHVESLTNPNRSERQQLYTGFNRGIFEIYGFGSAEVERLSSLSF